MSEIKFGFIGTGNMGAALARAVRKSAPTDTFLLSNRSQQKAQALARELDCEVADNVTVAAKSQFIFLGVKPQMMSSVLTAIAPVLAQRKDRFVIVTMAAGLSIDKYNTMLGTCYPIIRIMPNTPASIGDGVILYSVSEDVYMDEITEFCKALSHAGFVDRIDESLIDAAAAVSGCGPAFVYMFTEALADAGVECGLSRAKALAYAAHTVSGAANLISATGKHPGQLKDEVCSPAGTTIAGVHALENASFRGTVMNAVKAAYDKTKSIGK